MAIVGAQLVPWSKSIAETTSAVTVTIPKIRDLGIDKYGFRLDVQNTPQAGLAYNWIHDVTDTPPGANWKQGAANPTSVAWTLPHDTTDDQGIAIPDNQPWPNYYTVEVLVTPAHLVSDITFHRRGTESGCVSLAIGPIDSATGKIRLRIKAEYPSTPLINTQTGERTRKVDGTVIYAKYKGSEVAGSSAEVYVIRPEFLNRSVVDIIIDAPTNPSTVDYHAMHEGSAILTPIPSKLVGDADVDAYNLANNTSYSYAAVNDQHQAPPFIARMRGVYKRDIQVWVLDQYRKQLPLDIYGGTGVTEDDIWIAWSKGPYYTDPVWIADIPGADMIYKPINPVTGALDPASSVWEVNCPGAQLNPRPWTPPPHSHVIRVAGWLLDNGNPLKRQLSIKDPPTPNNFELLYSLKWV